MTSLRPTAAATLTLFALLAALSSQAAPPAEEGRCELRVATGPRGKVYEKLFADMRSVCGDEVTLCAVPSEGGLQNLSLLAASQADVGLVQLDTVDTMKDGDESVRRLQAVMTLHANLLHVLSLTAGSQVGATMLFGKPVPGTSRTVLVRNYEDLRGLRVAAVGSAQLMGRTIDRQFGFKIEFDNADSDEQALELAVQRARDHRLWELLTAREKEVAPLLAQGLSSKEIARQLVPECGFRVVEGYRAKVFEKLDVANAAELHGWMARNRWLVPE